MKVLILRFSSIGDIVLTTPVIRNLKRGLNGVEVHMATKAQFKSILEPNPYLDKIHLLDEGLNPLIQKLKKEKFDLVLDLHNNVRTLRVKKALGVKARSFRKLNIQKWIMVNFKKDLLPQVHIVDRYLATLEGLGIVPDQEGLDYFIADSERYPLEMLPGLFQKGYLAFAIGGQHGTKMLPPSKVVEAIVQLKPPVILLGGEAEEKTGDQILDLLPEGKRNQVINLAGKLSIGQSASIVQQSMGVLTNDTGVMHIGAAFKKPIVSFWGNTIPDFGMTPYKTRSLIVENKNLSCRPCTKLGFDTCPKGHFKCMMDLEMEGVSGFFPISPQEATSSNPTS